MQIKRKQKRTKPIEMDYGQVPAAAAVNSAAQSQGSFPWVWIIVGIIVAAIISVVVYLVVGRAETRPIKQGFYGGAITGTSSFPCSRMSSEADQLYSIFASKSLTVGEEGQADLTDLKDLLSKMCCLKQDLMSPAQTITAVKELGFATHQDIQPVADLTGRCFSKTIPERDLSVQFIKWRNSAQDLVRRLCTASQMTEAETAKAEKLFAASWKDVYNVAQTNCLSGLPKGIYSAGPHDPAPSSDAIDGDLRPYDGLY
jgi:hypothetical protein